MVEEPTFPRTDCQKTRIGGQLLFTNCDKKQTPLRVDFAERGYNVKPMNSESDENLNDVGTSLQSQTITLFDSVHNDSLLQSEVDDEVTNCRNENTNYSAAGDHLTEFRIFDGNTDGVSLNKEDSNGTCSVSTAELYSASGPHDLGRVTNTTQELRTELMNVSNSNGCISSKDSKRERADSAGLDVTFNMASVSTYISHHFGENKDQHCLSCELTSVPNMKDSDPDNLPTEGQHDNLLVPACSSPLTEEMLCNVQKENQIGDSLTAQGSNYLEQDLAIALWVKWRGKWQSGIRCTQADCPLQALKAKPQHERKRYIPIFFPRTRTYSWADMQFVCPIDKLPEPLVRGTHRKWRKLVKDSTLPHLHMMHKLAAGMLNIGDRLHTEAVVEHARKAAAWKEFVMEASLCREYADLGRMLLKLQNMILPRYISNNWLEDSLVAWKMKSQNAQSAGSIETLMEELIDSILWVEVNELWTAPVQPEFGLDWKSSKQETMRLFFPSHAAAIFGDKGQDRSSDYLVMGHESSRKRPKLEISLAEASTSETEAPTCILSHYGVPEADRRICNSYEVLESTPPCQPCKMEELPMVVGSSQANSLANAYNAFVDEGESVKQTEATQVGYLASIERGQEDLLRTQNECQAKERYRQCQAFVPSKGRQCGRWASDGDIYCCVHLSSHYMDKLSQEEQKHPVEAPMCEGTTTHGRKCKHHARQGSTFCKKHQILGSHRSMHNYSHSSGNTRKVNKGENLEWESFSSSNLVSCDLSLPKVQTTHENLVSVVIGVTLDERNCLMKKSELYNALPAPVSLPSLPLCIGNCRENNDQKCLEYATKYTLYCNNHLPKFLKRARNGKSRLVSKDIFLDLLKKLNSRKEKLYLHQACELLHGFMKSGMSRQRPVSSGDTMTWILSEASRDPTLGEFLLKLVSSEREKLSNVWGFSANQEGQNSSCETKSTSLPMLSSKEKYTELSVKCKICAEDFTDDHQLGLHWAQLHKKEARWLFRGYACGVCMTSFTNRKVLETHVKERHGLQFLEHSIIFRCMPCNSHFGNSEQLWQHILSSHTKEFILQHTLDQTLQPKIEISNLSCSNYVSENHDVSQKFTCRFCGLRFDLLPDLGRHHQVAHMNPNSNSQFPSKRGNHHLKRNRHSYPTLKKKFDTSYNYKKDITLDIPKCISSLRSIRSIHSFEELQTQSSKSLGLGQLLDIHCSGVADILFSEIQKTKPRPSSREILSIARNACCRTNFNAALEVKYGPLQENIYLKALKLCSELNIQACWHIEDSVCPRGCKPLRKLESLAPLHAIKSVPSETASYAMDSFRGSNWDMDESHYILNLENIYAKSTPRTIILCEDVSFGREPVPIACVVDEYMKDSFLVASHEVLCCQELHIYMPWKVFTYVTKRLIGPSLYLEAKDLQTGCKCPDSICNPKNCDHDYLFDDDHINAKDITGNLTHTRFAYDERGRIALEEGRQVYECNSMCKCNATCANRVLQKGVQVKLEIFRTEKKGWAVRTREAISRGTFVCEYIGELLNDEGVNREGERHDSGGCSYSFDIDAHIDGARGSIEGVFPYVIDATKYGNVARFINHSCSPNLASYFVFVDNMDFQLAHIGLYASRDIDFGEELAYDYRPKLLPGEGHPCHCGATNCRGRLY